MKRTKVKALVLGTVFLLGSMGFGFSQGWNPGSSQQGTSQYAGQQKQQAYKGSIAVAQSQTDENYAEMPANLEKMAKISLQQALQAAVNANSGTSAVGAELGNENGFLIYSVSLNNGLDVKVDAGTGQIVHTEKAGTDHEHHTEERSSKEEQRGGEEGSEGGSE
ncbi:MAG: hypothetical protein GXP33_10130 [Spirochaetes bacterium]|nr:hypothetical protein [Spirochaetota bacterium]